MLTTNVETAALSPQAAQRVERAGAAADVRSDSSADDTELGKWTETEDKTRTKYDVDPVCQPQCAHRDRCVARAAKDCIHHKQHDDGHVSRKHYTRERGTVFDHPRRTTHHCQQLRRKRSRGKANDERNERGEYDRLNSSARGAVGILFADAARDHRHRADAETDGESVNQCEQRFSQSNGCGGVGSEM
jgi:hypothetical protein